MSQHTSAVDPDVAGLKSPRRPATLARWLFLAAIVLAAGMVFMRGAGATDAVQPLRWAAIAAGALAILAVAVASSRQAARARFAVLSAIYPDGTGDPDPDSGDTP